MDFNSLLTAFGSLVGVGALIAILVNLAKLIGWVKDGTAQTWSAVLNIVGLIALLSLKLFKPDVSIPDLDAQAGALADVLVALSGFIVQLLSSKATHLAVRNVPVIGKSNS